MPVNVFVLVVAVLVALGVGFGAAYLLLRRRQGKLPANYFLPSTRHLWKPGSSY